MARGDRRVFAAAEDRNFAVLWPVMARPDDDVEVVGCKNVTKLCESHGDKKKTKWQFFPIFVIRDLLRI